ncbi:MAG: zinc-dependent metalloprotease [Flavobacteriales bacterium]|nr:zinc-dependent metalloprotease [Flavobacteriales bacterium]
MLGSPAVHALDKKKETKEPKKEEGIKPLKEITAKCRLFKGLYPILRDTANGDLYLVLTETLLGRELLHFSQVVDGVVDAGFFRGAYGQSRILRFDRYFDRVDLIQRNTGYYFDPESPLSKARGANINEPVLLSEKIVAMNKAQDSLIIKANELYLGEGLEQMKHPAPKGMEDRWFDLGKLEKDRSKVLDVRNYPMNTDVISEYVWSNPYPRVHGGEEVTDARSVSVKVHHSFIQLPENDFRPRRDDPRVGYFYDQIEDMTTTDAVNYRDQIHRWHLKKKDPAARVSDPVEPITWWIENTTPKELRPSIREGVLAWNEAFELAGISNALVVKEQPDTASWDAGDIRYNVLRWTSSPEPPFGGYGPSFVDPRTGQILGADVMLEYVFVTNRLRERELFRIAGMGMMALSEEELLHSKQNCTFASDLHMNVLFGSTVLDAMDLSEMERSRFLQEALRDLTLHEVGHTLGLSHNMKASSIHTVEQLRDKEITGREGITGSVMDYSPANLPWEPGDEVDYFHSTPGPYDKWAIRYGYTEIAGNKEVENAKLREILAESTSPLLIFGNDADDMRSPGHGIDPRVMIFDMSADPVEHGLRTIQIAERTMATVKDRYATGHRSYQELRDAYMVLTGRMINACNVMTRQIGGIYVDRSFADQETSEVPYRPVEKETQ